MIRFAFKKGNFKFDDPNTSLPRKMWEQFFHSKKHNKALLHILFGEYDDDNEQEQDTFARFDFYFLT